MSNQPQIDAINKRYGVVYREIIQMDNPGENFDLCCELDSLRSQLITAGFDVDPLPF